MRDHLPAGGNGTIGEARFCDLVVECSGDPIDPPIGASEMIAKVAVPRTATTISDASLTWILTGSFWLISRVRLRAHLRELA